MNDTHDEHHVISNDGKTFTCTHCGESIEIALPISVALYVEAFGKFVQAHDQCPPRDL
jgi:hypothetical protein